MTAAELARAARERGEYFASLVGREVRFSEHGQAVIGLLDDTFGLGGRRHFGDLSRVNWEHASCVSLFYSKPLATFNDDTLTQLVVRCHDASIRLQIDAVRPRVFQLTFSARARTGTRYERHPELEPAIQQVRSQTYFGRVERRIARKVAS